jgi:voltage-gated potassium channel Kch
VKASIQDFPYLAVAITFTLASLITAYYIYIAERNPRTNINSNIEEMSKLNYYNENIWTMIVTATTVGYGDIYPWTHLGRTTAMIMSILGNFFLGLMVVTLSMSLYHTRAELKTYTLIYKKH